MCFSVLYAGSMELSTETVLSSDSVAVFKSRLKTFLLSQAFTYSPADWQAAWPQRLWSYNIMALYKSVVFIIMIFISMNMLV